MKRILYVLLAVVLSSSITIAQDQNDKESKRAEKREKIKAMKIAYLTEELSLTEDEAQAFWPVYNSHADQIKALRKEHRSLREKFKGKSIDDLTDQEATELVDGEMNFREKKFNIEKQFNADLKSVLPVKKVLKFHKAERKFKRKLLKKMRKGKHGRKGRGPRGPGGAHGDSDDMPPMHD